jgi:hypothetical protein
LGWFGIHGFVHLFRRISSPIEGRSPAVGGR